MPDERYFSAKDIQVTLGISRGRAYEIIHQMPRVRFGTNVRVAESDFQNWLTRHHVMPAPEGSLEARRAKLENYKRQLGLENDNPQTIRPTLPRDRKPDRFGPGGDQNRPIRPTRPRD